MNINRLAAVALVLIPEWLLAGELIRNGAFAEMDARDLPHMWTVKQTGGAICKVNHGENGNDFTMTVADNGQTALAVQKDLPLINGKKYILNYTVGGASGAQYQIYVEYRLNGRLKSSAATVQTVGEKLENRRTVFTLPEGATGPYLVLRARKNTVVFRRVSLLEMVSGLPTDSLVKNGDFMEYGAKNLPLGWEMRGKGGIVATGEDGGNFLRLPAGALALQRKLALKPGGAYQLNCQVRSSDPENSFMVYCEWSVSKKLQSKVAPKRLAAEEWSDCTLEFVFPGDASGAYVALLAKKGVVEFRNVVIVEKK